MKVHIASIYKRTWTKEIALLHELNIHTIEDLVLYLPTRYEDNTVVDLNLAEDQSTVTVAGEIYSVPTVAFLAGINQN